MTRLILMRHGNTFEEGQTPVQVGAKTDLPLTAFGREQAGRMVGFLKGNAPKAIFSGRLKRQKESAEIIANAFGLNVQFAPALVEIDYGLWEGLTAEEIAKKWPKENAEWSNEAKWQGHIFNGNLEEHWQGLQEWIKTLCTAFPNETVFGVTSNGLLRLFRNEKVKTGHYCELLLHGGAIQIVQWNRSPII